MQIISPVLANQDVTAAYSPAAYGPAQVNFTTGAAVPATTSTAETTDTGAVDPRRYTKFDRSASKVADATMSFGDFLDMVNPLQHIPIISAAYRAVTGDKINPVSHVAGDIMYGAILGPVTALTAGAGAIADSVMEEKTGKSVSSNVYAALFGSDGEIKQDGIQTQEPIQLAAAALPQLSFSTEEKPPAATVEAASIQPAVVQPAVVQPASLQASNDKTTSQPQGIALRRNNAPYGGVLAPTKSMQEQNRAMAVASATGGRHSGNNIYANRFNHGERALAVTPPAAKADMAKEDSSAGALSSTEMAQAFTTPIPQGADKQTLASSNLSTLTAAQLSAPAAPPAAATVPADNTIPPNLADDALLLKALGLYQSTAANVRPSNKDLN